MNHLIKKSQIEWIYHWSIPIDKTHTHIEYLPLTIFPIENESQPKIFHWSNLIEWDSPLIHSHWDFHYHQLIFNPIFIEKSICHSNCHWSYIHTLLIIINNCSKLSHLPFIHSFHTMPCHAIPIHLPYHIISYHAMPCHSPSIHSITNSFSSIHHPSIQSPIHSITIRSSNLT